MAGFKFIKNIVFTLNLIFIRLIKNPEKKLKRVIKLINQGSEYKKYLCLQFAADASFDLGNMEEAKKYANLLLALSKNYPEDFYYGNAIFYANHFLGRIALHNNDIELAKEYLLKAGNTPGSPQLDSFGPNMSLPKELLECGQEEVVLSFFELCRKFWKMDNGQLDYWAAVVKSGGKPNFGKNLIY